MYVAAPKRDKAAQTSRDPTPVGDGTDSREWIAHWIASKVYQRPYDRHGPVSAVALIVPPFWFTSQHAVSGVVSFHAENGGVDDSLVIKNTR